MDNKFLTWLRGANLFPPVSELFEENGYQFVNQIEQFYQDNCTAFENATNQTEKAKILKEYLARLELLSAILSALMQGHPAIEPLQLILERYQMTSIIPHRNGLLPYLILRHLNTAKLSRMFDRLQEGAS